MKPIIFTCVENLPMVPSELANGILDLSRWPEFTGYGPLPGVRSAAFEVRTSNVVGTRIRVTNTDGSRHLEEIVVWEPDRLLQLAMTDFSLPLARLAERFVETWEFEPVTSGTQVTRSFELHPKSTVTRPILWLISRFLARAIARHLRWMSNVQHTPR